MLKKGQALVGSQKRQNGADTIFRSGNRAVDALVGQQQSALHLVGHAASLQRRLEGLEIGQIDEFVEGGGEVQAFGQHAVIIRFSSRVMLHK